MKLKESVRNYVSRVLRHILRWLDGPPEVYVVVHMHQKGTSVVAFSTLEEAVRDCCSWVEKYRDTYEVPEDEDTYDVWVNWKEHTDYEEELEIYTLRVQ